MTRRKDMEPIPVTPVTRASREWTLRFLRRYVVGLVVLVVVLLVLNALAASMGYGSF